MLQGHDDEVTGTHVLRSDEGIVTNELPEEGMRGTVGAVVIDKGSRKFNLLHQWSIL